MGKEDRDENALIERIEKAAREGAEKGAKGQAGFRGVPANVLTNILTGAATVCIVVGAVLFINHSMEHRLNNIIDTVKEQLAFGDPAENHDLVLENHGLFGFTAADFADAILGDSTQLKKIEVFSQEVADVVTVTDAGIANIKIFEKNQIITYHGTATYTVDLSRVLENDVKLNEDDKTITLYIPHCEMEKINIPEDEMEFGDVTKGLLAFGDIKLTPEQNRDIQAAARAKMEEKLEETKAINQADRFAKMSVWEMYQPVVSGVSPEYTLEVEFAD